MVMRIRARGLLLYLFLGRVSGPGSGPVSGVSVFPKLRPFLSFFVPYPLSPFPKLTQTHGK